jgi:tRNA acetyltransferase TAN1
MSDRNSGRTGRKKYGGHNNPRRGAPGVLLTCETGREGKCRREGLDILRHYLNDQAKKNETNEKKKKPLTLEEEITLLQKGVSSEQVLTDESCKAFVVYETGCRGTVFAMCTLPSCDLIPCIRLEKRKVTQEADGNDSSKRARLEQDEMALGKADDSAAKSESCEASKLLGGAGDTSGAAEIDSEPPWDPLDTVHRILKDLDSSSTSAPSSRFVTRMVPIQATCFVSLEEIGMTSKALIQKYLADKTPSTFAVVVKKRNCATLTRDQVIDSVARELIGTDDSSKWKVNLTSPDFTFQVEICKTLCGMSIIENATKYRNFNLVEIREASQAQKDETS